jgi:hypothetical protein
MQKVTKEMVAALEVPPGFEVRKTRIIYNGVEVFSRGFALGGILSRSTGFVAQTYFTAGDEYPDWETCETLQGAMEWVIKTAKERVGGRSK